MMCLPTLGGYVESLAGSLYEVAFTRTARGQVRDLPGLVPELSGLVLRPYTFTS